MPETQDGFKLFVGDLPPDVSAEELQTVFRTYGEVLNVHLMPPNAKSNNRCALLFYAQHQSAEDAISVLNGVYKIREGAEQAIKVSWAKDKNSAPAVHMDADGYKLFVGGLPPDCTSDELTMVFTTYGEVNKVHIMPPHAETGRVAAFVYYKASQSAEDSINVLHEKYKIRQDAELPILVKWAQTKDAKGEAKGGGKGSDSWGGGKASDSWGGGGGKGGWGGRGGDVKGGGKIRAPEGWKMFVGALPADITESELHIVFSTYGEVAKVHVMPPNAQGKVAAFVYYVNEQSGEDAIKVLNNVYKIRADAPEAVQVRWASEKGASKGDAGKGSWAGGESWGSGGKGQGGGSWDSKGPGGKGGGKGGGKAALGWGGQVDDWAGGGWSGKVDSWDGGGVGWSDKGGRGWDDAYGKGGGKPGSYQKGWGDSSSKGWSGRQDGGKGGGSSKAGNWDVSDTKLFVGNLPEDVTDDALKYVFGTYGVVQNVHIMLGKSKTGNACAFVELSSPGEAETAILTLHDKYEIKPGYGKILVKKANSGRQQPY